VGRVLAVIDLNSHRKFVAGSSSQNFASAPDVSSPVISHAVTSTTGNGGSAGIPADYGLG